MMGEAAGKTNDWYIGAQSINTRPHSSLGFDNSPISGSTGLSEPRDCFKSLEPMWRSSSKYIDPGYGYEKDWRSSRAMVQGRGDSHLGRDVAPVASGEQDQWKSSIRYIDPGSGSWSAGGWRSSIKTVEPQRKDIHPEWRPRIRVFKLSDCRAEWRMTGGRRHVPPITHPEPLWRSCRSPGNPPPLKWIPPFRNLKLPPPKIKSLRKRVSGYSRKHPQLQLFSPSLEIAGRRPNSSGLVMSNGVLLWQAQQIRAKVAAYFRLHPPLHLFSNSFEKPGSGSREPTNDDFLRSVRRYIPNGHEDHFENAGCIARTSTALPGKTAKIWCATGPQHDPATCRNVIAGKIGPMDDYKPPNATLGPTLLAPAGNFNKDVIDNRFAGPQNTLEPEIPSYSSQLFSKAYASAQEDYKRNVLNDMTTRSFDGLLV